MFRLGLLIGLGLMGAAALAAQEPRIITGLKQPESVAIGAGGTVYVSETGEYEKANDGYISILQDGQLKRFATGLDDPHGIKWYRGHLFVADNMGIIWRIDSKGNPERFVDATDFPRKITNFNDLEIDAAGNLYLSDSGDWEGRGGAIYRISQDKKITVVLTDEDDWRLVSPNGLLMDGPSKLLVVDYTTGILFRVDLKGESKTMERLAPGFGSSDGLVRDSKGRLLITSFATHKLYVVTKPDVKPQEIEVAGVESAADLAISPDGKSLLIPDMSGGKLAIVPMP
ncbi:MAG TPA: SMP-30/gluconolactonase/LRE family protein [Gemmatimonadales bacterium]|nr:SMP-30/gluconolactonase/LRE family protein [Gemmatimonadales bacterium]